MELKRNNSFLFITFLMIAALPAYRCIMYIFQVVNLTLPLRMYHIYFLMMVYMIVLLVKYKLPINRIVALGAFLAFYGINYIWATPDARVYFNTTEVSAILLSFAPIACFCTSRVEDWDELFTSKLILTIVDIVISVSLISKLQAFNLGDYMSFSYGLLPLWGISLVSALYYKKNFQWIFLGIGVFEGLVYGARAPLIWVVVLSVVTWIIQTREDINRKSFRHLIPGILFGVVAIVFIETILPMILESTLSGTSYVLRRLQGNSLFEGAGRESIYMECRRIISEMGLNINGLFYDRTVLPNGMYSHNFIYEILISFGWIIGVPCIIGLIYFVINAFIKQNRKGKVITTYFCCTFFFRYFLSGSIFDETGFVLFLAVICSLKGIRSSTLNKNILQPSA